MSAYLVHEGEGEGDEEEAKTSSCKCRGFRVKDVVERDHHERLRPVFCSRKKIQISSAFSASLGSTHTWTQA